MKFLNGVKKGIIGIGILVLGYYVIYAALSIMLFLIIFLGLYISNLFGG